MFSMYLKMNLGPLRWRHPFSVISPWMFFCSMGRVLMPWTSGSSPLCTRLPPRIVWKFVLCCWVMVLTQRWSTATGRARWTWPRPQNSKRGSHVSLPFLLIKLTPRMFGISTIFVVFKRRLMFFKATFIMQQSQFKTIKISVFVGHICAQTYLTKLTSETAYWLNDLQQNKGSFGYN